MAAHPYTAPHDITLPPLSSLGFQDVHRLPEYSKASFSSSDSGSTEASAQSVVQDPRRMIQARLYDQPEYLSNQVNPLRRIVNQSFSHMALLELLRVRETININRSLFRSTKKTLERSHPKDSKNAKHNEAERSRRAIHGDFYYEMSKRICDDVMELAGYKVGTTAMKPPGKHHLHKASLLQYEFDCMLQDKMVSEWESTCERAEQAEQSARDAHKLNQDVRFHTSRRILNIGEASYSL